MFTFWSAENLKNGLHKNKSVFFDKIRNNFCILLACTEYDLLGA